MKQEISAQGEHEILAYRRLLAATLYQAAQDYSNARIALAKLPDRPDVMEKFQEIRDWFMSESDEPMTYAWICDMLNIPRHRIREQLHTRWRELQRRPPSNVTW